MAAIKAPLLVRRLQEAGAEVRVVATDDGLRFTTALSLAAASGYEVLDRDAWFRPDGEARHLTLSRWADAMLVAPASADALAAAAGGRADDPVSVMALVVPEVVWAPAMNPAMWGAAAVRRNVALLRDAGHRVLEPASGRLGTVGEGVGVGRMPDEDVLVEAVLPRARARDLSGRRVVVSAGPTREWIDPVRFLSNPSSGRMGVAVAEAARDRGAQVTLVHGPLSVGVPEGVDAVAVESAQEMLEALRPAFASCDLLVMSAAVADFRPRARADRKVPKAQAPDALPLVRNPDLLQSLGAQRASQVMVGFAMETDTGVDRAAAKARDKGLAFAVLNYPTREGTGFGGEHNQVTVVRPTGESESLPRMTKRATADAILDRVLPLLP